MAISHTEEPMTSPSLQHIQTVLLDDLGLVWARFQNRNWVHADLTPLIESTPSAGLTDLKNFQAGDINTNGTHLQWPTGASLPLTELSGAVGSISPAGAVIRQLSSHPHGWYRPLLPLHGNRAPWEHQAQAEAAALLADALAYSVHQFQLLIASYPAEPGDLSARLLDLLDLIDSTNHAHARHHLLTPWAVGRHTPHLITPLTAIHHGRLALVEHILATRQPLSSVPLTVFGHNAKDHDPA
ncbi:hypothetical protein ACFFLM_06695 [Deinococcus oregonensis]|uniref:Uncharacterized protein n=1 Tax=Deinococcus oregonensis TaxID=1805970 RepID=A0ABV6AVX9_9DEIO